MEEEKSGVVESQKLEEDARSFEQEEEEDEDRVDSEIEDMFLDAMGEI